MVRSEWLFKTLTVKGVSIRNRIVMPAMNSNFAEADGSVGEQFTRYYVERGKGGVGLIIISPAYIDPAARKRVGSLLLHEDRFIPKLKTFTDAIHATGAKVLQQLNHNGRLLTSSKDLKTSAKPGSAVGPSAIPHLLTGEIPHVLNVEEIKELTDKFGQAARRAKEAGFDGVEINGAHGYLINEFFSLYSNRRTDEYGGNLNNRIRFPLEVYRRVRELTGNNFLVSYRLSAREFAPVETPLEDVIELCQRLDREGVDFLHISAGNSETPAMLLKVGPFGSVPPGCYADLAAAIKARVKIPVIAVGRINTPEIAEQILSQGKADLVATGRALIADPHWPGKAFRGELDKIRKCVGCHQGCSERISQEKGITCLYNPEVGREGELSLSSEKKTVWVIGGGPGGMEAASVAALRGHDVQLHEKSGKLGGQCLLAETPPGKEEFLAVRDFLAKELQRQKVSIHLNDEMTAEKVAQGRPDVVIVATGALPLIPKIPGVQGKNVVTAWDVLKGKEIGEKVVIAGAGLVGIETALFLSKKGKQVTLIEMLEEIGADAGPLNRVRLNEALQGSDIEVKCKTELLRIGKKQVTVRGEKGEYEIPTETIVLALGAKPQNGLFQKLQGKVSELYAIGDCVSPRKMIDAIYEAYDLSSKI
jgi:2,4-dienoyl-CoA reductase-like NADH-dependent reductase (Old Yellow Enzyme family)/thioredoxin reductase